MVTIYSQIRKIDCNYLLCKLFVFSQDGMSDIGGGAANDTITISRKSISKMNAYVASKKANNNNQRWNRLNAQTQSHNSSF